MLSNQQIALCRHRWLSIKYFASNMADVSQGSILGSLLSLMYINDLHSCVNHSDCLLFTDDAKISQAVTSFQDQLLLQIDLHETEQWCSIWNLQLNPNKCHVLKFMLSRATPTSSQLHHYYLVGNALTFSNSETDLGVVVQCDLSWSEH